MAQKSVPNLRAAKTSDSYVAATSTPDRAQSSHETADNNVGPDSTVPRTPRSLSRKLSVAMLPKRSVSDDIMQTRPTTDPSKTLKARSISLEQLKTLRGSRKMSAPETPVEVPPFPPRPSTRQETVKGQLLHHFKTDHVADAWETAGKKEKGISRRSSLKKLDGPLSIFRVKSLKAPSNSERPQTASFENDLEKQMAWLQRETASLNTYSLAPKREESPRIHVVPIHQTLTEEEEEAEEEEEVDGDHAASGNETTKADEGSLFTALPSFPLPPVRITFSYGS